ncbi:13589_t:CDS:2, partial [Dentiscutata heterogama]
DTTNASSAFLIEFCAKLFCEHWLGYYNQPNDVYIRLGNAFMHLDHEGKYNGGIQKEKEELDREISRLKRKKELIYGIDDLKRKKEQLNYEPIHLENRMLNNNINLTEENVLRVENALGSLSMGNAYREIEQNLTQVVPYTVRLKVFSLSLSNFFVLSLRHWMVL